MGDVDAILAEVRFLATRGEHHLIVARYGRLDDAPQDDLWNSTDLLYEIGRAFGMLGNEDKVERYLLRCAELAPRRAAVFHCAIGWYFQRKKKWTKALRWYDRALISFPDLPSLSVPPRLLPREAAPPARGRRGAASARAPCWDQAGGEQRVARARRPGPGPLPPLARAARPRRLRGLRRGARRLPYASTPRPSRPPSVRSTSSPARASCSCAGATSTRARALFEEARCARSGVELRLGADRPRPRAARRRRSRPRPRTGTRTALPRGAFAFLALGRLHTEITHDHRAAASALAEALRQAAERRAAGAARARPPPARARPPARRARAGRAGARLPPRGRLRRGAAPRRRGRRASRALGEAATGHLRQLARSFARRARTSPARLATLERRRTEAPAQPPADAPLPSGFEVLGDAGIDAPGRARVEGVVDRFFAEKGFGFVRYGDGQTPLLPRHAVPGRRNVASSPEPPSPSSWGTTRRRGSRRPRRCGFRSSGRPPRAQARRGRRRVCGSVDASSRASSARSASQARRVVDVERRR